MAPALSSRLRFWVSDVDPARRRAERRLDLSLRGLSGGGLEVAGAIGDAEPLQAIADGLRVFPADEIVLVTHTEDEEHWVEHDLVERARAAFEGYPIVHLVAGARRLHVAPDLSRRRSSTTACRPAARTTTSRTSGRPSASGVRRTSSP